MFNKAFIFRVSLFKNIYMKIVQILFVKFVHIKRICNSTLAHGWRNIKIKVKWWAAVAATRWHYPHTCIQYTLANSFWAIYAAAHISFILSLLSSRFFAKNEKRFTLNVRKDHHISKCAYLSLGIYMFICYIHIVEAQIYMYIIWCTAHTHTESRPLCTSPRTRRLHSYISLSIKGNPFQSAASHYKRLCQSSSICPADIF